MTSPYSEGWPKPFPLPPFVQGIRFEVVPLSDAERMREHLEAIRDAPYERGQVDDPWRQLDLFHKTARNGLALNPEDKS